MRQVEGERIEGGPGEGWLLWRKHGRGRVKVITIWDVAIGRPTRLNHYSSQREIRTLLILLARRCYCWYACKQHFIIYLYTSPSPSLLHTWTSPFPPAFLSPSFCSCCCRWNMRRPPSPLPFIMLHAFVFCPCAFLVVQLLACRLVRLFGCFCV